ncbi:hypothetical protein [Ornithinimicrobium avium]|uniref:Uncharacterized protein n=1 Tax=Ornithinimicrobium avium TaxID=2283195 RepID=A0A345NJV2_9MICO|nr:hypothetical protein [Ornithinimicrobium avium]AXH95310.1 hypothetical protein DV701_03390 [Ornithinimicrobium avium]
MPSSLGERAARVRVRRLARDETFLLAALHLQGLRRRAVEAPDHVQRLGQAWHRRAEDHPAWVAECDEEHVGMAICRVPVLPQVGSGVPVLLALEALGEPGPEAVTLALVRTIVDWAGCDGHPGVDVDGAVTLPGPVLDAVRADVRVRRHLRLPTGP